MTACVSYFHLEVSSPNPPPLTQAVVESLADPGQDGQGDEVTEAGGDGRSHVVGVDARLLGSHDHSHHDEAWDSDGTEVRATRLHIPQPSICVFITNTLLKKMKGTLKQHNVTPSQSHFCEIKLSTDHTD